MIESIFEKLLNKERLSDVEILYLIGEYYKNNPIKYYTPTPAASHPTFPIIDYSGMAVVNIDHFYQSHVRMLSDDINELTDEARSLRT